jgi:hypothetical protein
LDNIISLALPLLILILLGFATGRIAGGEHRGLYWLNILVVYFALPALIFRLVAAAPIEQLANGAFVLATTLSGYLVFMIMFAVATVIGRFPIGVAAIQASGASYANAGYLGIPLAYALFGDEGALPATLVVTFDAALHFVLVPLLQGLGRPRTGLAEATGGLVELVTNPLILALVLGGLAAFFGVGLPLAVGGTIDLLAAAAAPAALFAIGITVARQPAGQLGWEVPVIALCKLVLHPLVTLLALVLIGGIDPVWITVAVMLAALPTAANVYVLAARFDAYTEGASSVILITTLLAVATVSALLVAIDQGALPMTAAELLR